MKYVTEIQSLRGLCALGVLLNHNFGPGFGLTSDGSSRERLFFEFFLHILAPGASMVLVFFVISGFVLSPTLTAISKLPNFFIRRIFRIMPALWASLVLAIFVFNYLGREIKPEYYKAFYLMDISLNQPIWSLQFEMLAYLYFPLQLFLSRKVGNIGSLVIIIFLIYLNISANFYSFYGLLIYPTALLCFQLGIEVPRFGKRLVTSMHSDNILFFIGLTCILLPLPVYNLVLAYNLGICNSIIAIGAFILISVISYGEFHLKKIFLFAPIVFLGTISYSFYLFHLPILEFVYINLPYSWIAWSNTHGPFGNSLFYVGIMRIFLTLIILIPMSWVSYRYVELPMIRVGNKLAKLLKI